MSGLFSFAPLVALLFIMLSAAAMFCFVASAASGLFLWRRTTHPFVCHIEIIQRNLSFLGSVFASFPFSIVLVLSVKSKQRIVRNDFRWTNNANTNKNLLAEIILQIGAIKGLSRWQRLVLVWRKNFSCTLEQ